MPIYPIKCPGCFRGDAFSKIADVVKHDGKVRCPSCGKLAEQDYAAKGVSVVCDELHGTRQRPMCVRASPEEVPELRRRFGDKGGANWQDDGRVVFKSKSEAAKFFKREDELKRAGAEKKAAKGGGKTERSRNADFGLV